MVENNHRGVPFHADVPFASARVASALWLVVSGRGPPHGVLSADAGRERSDTGPDVGFRRRATHLLGSVVARARLLDSERGRAATPRELEQGPEHVE